MDELNLSQFISDLEINLGYSMQLNSFTLTSAVASESNTMQVDQLYANNNNIENTKFEKVKKRCTNLQHLDQHTLMKQVTILNKQLALLRANQAANPQAIQTLPLENVTNVFNNVSNVLPQTTVTTTTKSSSNKENISQATTTAKTTLSRRGPKPLPRDPVTGKIIRPLNPDGAEIVKHRKSKKQNSENNQLISNFIKIFYRIFFI
jgi:hypothetical protein